MLIDIRKFNVHSLKEFVREYCMIVLGILTALGLEHLATNRHHAQMAAESRERIVAEIRSNLDEIRTALNDNQRRRSGVDKLIASLRKEIKAGTPNDKINGLLSDEIRHLTFGYVMPSLRHEQWDVAVANLSASYIDADALRRYCAAYAAQREITAITVQGSGMLLNGPRLIDVLTDFEMQKTDPLELLKVLKQMTGTLSSHIGNLDQLRSELEASLAREEKA